MKEYMTLSHDGEAVIIERKSRFIGYAAPVKNETAAREYINYIRELNPEANHCVWCYIFNSENITRCSDDGEPSGTAGRPVCEVFQREGLTDIVCVVVRYFGGILLGAGGLIRAYSSCAKAALDAAGKAVMKPYTDIAFEIPYRFFGKLEAYFTSLGTALKDKSFAETVIFTVTVPEGDVSAIISYVADITAGKANAEPGTTVYAP